MTLDFAMMSHKNRARIGGICRGYHLPSPYDGFDYDATEHAEMLELLIQAVLDSCEEVLAHRPTMTEIRTVKDLLAWFEDERCKELFHRATDLFTTTYGFKKFKK